MKNLLLPAMLLIAVATSYSQRRFQENNGIGIMAGVNQINIKTSNFDVTPSLGWNAGLQVRGAIYNDFYMVYAIQFNENNFSVATLNGALQPENVDYKISGGQISLQLSYSIIDSHLSIEAGPVFQFNGKMKIDADKSGNTIKGTDLKAAEIVDINPFNFHAAIGFTAGVKHLRLSLQYIHGLNNILNKLNDQQLGYDFKGNIGIISGNVIVFL